MATSIGRSRFFAILFRLIVSLYLYFARLGSELIQKGYQMLLSICPARFNSHCTSSTLDAME